MSGIDVQLRAEWIISVGYRYDVFLDGEAIVSRSRDPEHDAARALLARGLRGTFRTIDFVTGRHRMTLDIAKAARLRSIERDEGGLTVGPYQPMSEDDKSRIFSHRSHQGRVFRGRRLQGTGEPIKRTGGETSAASRRVPEEA
jgi:hypothetical protein